MTRRSLTIALLLLSWPAAYAFVPPPLRYRSCNERHQQWQSIICFATLNNDNPFRILNLPPNLNLDKTSIKRAYKAMILKYHPDAVTNKDSTAEQKKVANDDFVKINWAYATLNGPSKDLLDYYNDALFSDTVETTSVPNTVDEGLDFSDSENNDDLVFYQKNENLQELGMELEKTELFIQQLFSKAFNIGKQFSRAIADMAIVMRYSDRVELEGIAMELEAEKNVVDKRIEDSKKLFIELQVQYTILLKETIALAESQIEGLILTQRYTTETLENAESILKSAERYFNQAQREYKEASSEQENVSRAMNVQYNRLERLPNNDISSFGSDMDFTASLQSGNLQEVTMEIGNIKLMVRQLSSKLDNVEQELGMFQIDTRLDIGIMEQMRAEENAATLQAAKKVATYRLENARKRMSEIQTWYNDAAESRLFHLRDAQEQVDSSAQYRTQADNELKVATNARNSISEWLKDYNAKYEEVLDELNASTATEY